MNVSGVLVELVIVLGVAAVVTVGFQAARLPVVLGYVLAGLLIGPHVPVPLVANPHLVHTLSELGVILLMFTIGLEVRVETLARVGLPAGVTVLFEVGLAISVGALVARALGFTPVEAMFVGACLGISSTMLVAKAFEDRGWKGGFVDVVFAILIFEDLAAILLLAILGGVASGAGLGAADIAITVAKLAGFLVATLAVGLVVVPRGIRWIAQRARPETLMIGALAVCFSIAALADSAGYSVALGAFLAGILVAGSGHGHAVFDLVRPFRDVFAMMFFVSIGMTIAPAELAAELPTIAVLSLVVIFVKPLGVAVGTFFAGHGIRPAVRAGLSLSQIGELSFVIAGIGAASGVTRPSLLAIAVGVACVTTLTSSILIGRSEAIAGAAAARLPAPIATFESFYDAWLGRLRSRDATLWTRLRRPLVVLAFDAAIVVVVVIAAATAAPRGAAAIGLTGTAADLAILATATALAIPFATGAIRRIVRIARLLALEIVPDGGAALDLGRAPRRALILMLELALALAVAFPMVAITQPFLSGGAFALVTVLAVLGFLTYRSIVDFDGHVRAGSELLLELYASPADPHHPAPTPLPGFEDTTSLQLDATAPAIGQSLAQLDLRARTGATVLAIARDGSGLATPSPSEPLRAGDVLVLAGSADAIAATRTLLGTTAAAPPPG
ncbi:MAG TPA: cation:proton antiporter, partial [Kofleriaceae bacterium]|nr:cation:proton antiporter [Kofleriaceae bacterium]